jgi:hypothetical protein
MKRENEPDEARGPEAEPIKAEEFNQNLFERLVVVAPPEGSRDGSLHLVNGSCPGCGSTGRVHFAAHRQAAKAMRDAAADPAPGDLRPGDWDDMESDPEMGTINCRECGLTRGFSLRGVQARVLEAGDYWHYREYVEEKGGAHAETNGRVGRGEVDAS